ncbi:MAG TPA: hypothetical protein VNJ53_04600 [Gaiellaceae bacterium]|nr:hypothetical protein [Gaiellaceae bacterium]
MTDAPRQPAAQPVDWRRRLVIAAVVLVATVVLGLVGAAVIPRWWAQRIGDQVQGSLTAGILVGLVYGFLFTLLPLALLWAAFRLFGSWRARAGAVAVALLLAAPNLMTLGIVLGTGSGAHAGDRILDVEGPGFRGATLAGALAAAGTLAGAWYLLASRRRAWARARRAERSSEPEERP